MLKLLAGHCESFGNMAKSSSLDDFDDSEKGTILMSCVEGAMSVPSPMVIDWPLPVNMLFVTTRRRQRSGYSNASFTKWKETNELGKYNREPPRKTKSQPKSIQIHPETHKKQDRPIIQHQAQTSQGISFNTPCSTLWSPTH
jgi:hypothetical protein